MPVRSRRTEPSAERPPPRNSPQPSRRSTRRSQVIRRAVPDASQRASGAPIGTMNPLRGGADVNGVVPCRSGDDRQPARHRLENRVTAPFIIGRKRRRPQLAATSPRPPAAEAPQVETDSGTPSSSIIRRRNCGVPRLMCTAADNRQSQAIVLRPQPGDRIDQHDGDPCRRRACRRLPRSADPRARRPGLDGPRPARRPGRSVDQRHLG